MAVPQTLIDKIEALPIERVAEVEDFVDFIGLRSEQRALDRAAAAASAPAFAAVWNNPEDDAYDALEFGAVVLVPFPFTRQTASKKRPAVVVSSIAYAMERPDVVLMAVTSQLRPAPALGETWLRRWQEAGLIKPSAVKPVLATLEQTLIIRRLGRLAAEDQDALRTSVSQILG